MWRLVDAMLVSPLLVNQAERCVVPGTVGAPAMPSLS